MTKQLFSTLILAVTLFISPTSWAGKYDDMRAASLPVDLAQIGKVAIVVHGGDRLTYSFHQMRKTAAWGTVAVVAGGAAAGAIGGAVAGAVTVAARPDIRQPADQVNVDELSKVAKKDFEKQQQLDAELGAFDINQKIGDQFLALVKKRFSTEPELIVKGPDWPFEAVDKKFYQMGQDNPYSTAYYDYGVLADRGIQYVIEIVISGLFVPKSAFSGNPSAYLFTQANLIRLNTRHMIAQKAGITLGATKKFEDFAANGAELTKKSFESMIPKNVKMLAKDFVKK